MQGWGPFLKDQTTNQQLRAGREAAKSALDRGSKPGEGRRAGHGALGEVGKARSC